MLKVRYKSATNTTNFERTFVRWLVVGAFAAVGSLALFAVRTVHDGDAKRPASASAQQEVSVRRLHSLNALLALEADQLAGTDTARMNLLCAEGLPGVEGLNIDESLTTLDQWAQAIKRETARNFHHYIEDPQYFYNSTNFYKMVMMAVVLYEDYGLRYNPKWIAAPSAIRTNDHFFADSRDVFIHGLLGPTRTGTCSSMPVLYVAIGRRLGYPLKLVTTKQHLFLRWDSPTERFNMDATGKGLEKLDDDYFKKWPFPVTDAEIANEGYLKSLSPAEELSVFLSIRASCLTEAGQFTEATQARRAALRFAPNWKGNQIMLSQAMSAENQLFRSETLQTAVYESNLK